MTLMLGTASPSRLTVKVMLGALIEIYSWLSASKIASLLILLAARYRHTWKALLIRVDMKSEHRY